MEEDDEEQNKYRVSISYEEKERNLWNILIETHSNILQINFGKRE